MCDLEVVGCCSADDSCAGLRGRVIRHTVIRGSRCGNVSFICFFFIHTDLYICHSTFTIINIIAQEGFDLLPFSNSWGFKLILTPKNES